MVLCEVFYVKSSTRTSATALCRTTAIIPLLRWWQWSCGAIAALTTVIRRMATSMSTAWRRTAGERIFDGIAAAQ
jgi:hypothetical protein